jgi:hypothetical protein
MVTYDKSSIEVVDLPLRTTGAAGADAETVQVRHLPNHIIMRVQQAFEREKNGFRYDKTPAMSDDPTEVLAYLVGGLQGTKSIDKKTSEQLDGLVAEFSRVRKTERATFFKDRIRPFFSGLRTTKR